MGKRHALHAHGRSLDRRTSPAYGRGPGNCPYSRKETGIDIATKIAACAPLGIKTTLASAHLAIDAAQAEALSKLSAQYGALYRTEDFKEGRRAEAEGRLPVYQGK